MACIIDTYWCWMSEHNLEIFIRQYHAIRCSFSLIVHLPSNLSSLYLHGGFVVGAGHVVEIEGLLWEQGML